MPKSTFEQEIESNGKLIYTNKGDSMFPLIIEGKTLLEIVKPCGRLKKYDIPLYKRDNGQYVLHRVLKVRKKDYVICGDNRWQVEYGITDKHVIGVLTAVIRNGRRISIDDPLYKLYVHIWCDLFPLRAFIIRGWQFVKRRYKRIIRKIKKSGK